ncbi:MAG: hypothetical protein ACYS1A_11650 [Planctomycetota bacterium]|jgi:hypothetical protein
MIFQGNKIFVLLLVVATANGSPTVGTDIVSVFHPVPDTTAIISCTVDNSFGHSNTQLANLGAKFLQPPTAVAAPGGVSTNYVKPLPTVPAAMLLVMAGFICVSLVRDRRFWLAVLTGILWVGQTGIQTIPQVALRLSHRSHFHKQPYTQLAGTYYCQNSHRTRSDIEGTQYIGLLHYLDGIPDDKNTVNLHTSQPAIVFKKSSILQFRCLVSKAEQFICFTPAFIFQSIPRGPPLLD